MREYIVKFETDTPLSEITAGTTVRAMMKTVGDCDEVIRCKDCTFWRTTDHTCHEHSLVSPMSANEFCSRGERKQETK